MFIYIFLNTILKWLDDLPQILNTHDFKHSFWTRHVFLLICRVVYLSTLDVYVIYIESNKTETYNLTISENERNNHWVPKQD